MITNQEKEYAQLMQMALKKISKLEAEVDRLKNQDQSEAIAIIGMGCRIPGGASTPEAFWELLQNGVDAITEVPPSRWPVDEYYDSDPSAPGKMSTRYGGFIERLQEFDANFFGISPKETIHLDPQQRLLLEVSWEALERSGINPQKLKGSSTGVFVAIGGNGYLQKILTQGLEQIDAYMASGNTYSTASGRISYLLGLKGPNLAVDTGCSSSLVSVHLATTSLRNRESNLALAGGVNVLISPELHIGLSKAGMLSPYGRCKTFDSTADGFVGGEGCGMVILKRLSDAVADGDNILAVIRGTAINHDGDTSGLTVPSRPSQQAVIGQALENGGVDPASISYIEAHGTGTSLGDPIEVGAIGTVFGPTHSKEHPVIIGSAKSNVGHLASAAGIAGMIKVILQLQYRKIAPSLHFKQPNPYINWAQLPVQVATKLTSWPANGKSRIAGVSSFGMGGTNAHVIIEEAPSQVKIQNNNIERPVHLLTLSAKTEKALEDLVSNYQNYLETNPELALADVCYTASTG
ncbi:polyketide synthase, partial [Moorena sp. SIO4G3]|uniref:type I polyketide synthase n=1 Tax=Moorena sp. SIO4G3 TaxID=2607821 RepID=UPI00142CD5B0